MVTATISQVRNGLSAYLRRVRAGETVLIMDRKTPVARIVPLTHRTVSSPMSSRDDEARIERLIVEGVATRESDSGALEVLRELGNRGLPVTVSSERYSMNAQLSIVRAVVEILGYLRPGGTVFRRSALPVGAHHALGR